MISKDERQAECVSKWRNAKGRGTLNLTFRFGKTRVADIILTNYINKNGNNKILFLVPNDITKKNIIKNTKYGNEIELLTSNQFINKYKNVKDYIDYNLVIIDECHKFLDNEIYDYIIKINNSNMLNIQILYMKLLIYLKEFIKELILYFIRMFLIQILI